MSTLSLRTRVRNAAAVSSGAYGAVSRRAEEVGCSRQTVYEHARRVGHRLQPPQAPDSTPAEVPIPAPPPAALDEATRRRRAVRAFAMGISTRQIEDLLRVIEPRHGPDHSTIARWAAEEASKAGPVLEALDRASQGRVQTRAVDEVFLGGGPARSASNRRA